MNVGLLIEESRVENHCQAQCLSHAPCLGATPPRRVRRLRVEDLADGSYASTFQVCCQTQCDRMQLLDSVGVDATPRIDKRSNQPRPDGPLVIGKITRAQITEILWLVVRMARRK